MLVEICTTLTQQNMYNLTQIVFDSSLSTGRLEDKTQQQGHVQ